MENKWEYDYSNLYNRNNAASSDAQSTQEGAVNADTGYVNAGSSGTNTANTSGQAADSGSAGGYAERYAPAQPPQPPRGSHGGGRKWLMRGVSAVLVAAIGFAGGYGGSLVAAGRLGDSEHVVYRQVETTGESSAAAGLSIKDVAAMVSPSVVVITTEQVTTGNFWFGGSYVVSGAGSGVIMTEDGYIITNNHVVSGASSIKVTIGDEEYDATLIGADSHTDIAVVKVDATGLTPAVMGDSDNLAVGQTAIAVGNPLGTFGGSVTSGIISGLNREVTVDNQAMTLIQTDASVSPGNSGGGLFDDQGCLIGIVNSKSTGDYAEGIGFAIPVNTALSVAQDLIANGYVTGRPALGITVQVVGSEVAAQYGLSQGGVYIASVNEGSGAAEAGLQTGDLLVSVDDILVTDTSDVVNYIGGLNVGDTVSVQIQRDNRLMTVDVVLGESQQ